MDILNPSVVNIDGRIYCVYNNETTPYVGVEETNENEVVWDDEPSCNAEDSEIVKTAKGKYQLSLSIHNAFFKYVIRSKGETKRVLENETRTRIEIPRIGQDGDIIITGRTTQSVLSAKNRIELLISSKRWNEPFTHFVSIPLNTVLIKEHFDEFKKSVLKDFSTNRGVEESLFQVPSKLHLTICTLVLLNEKELQIAKSVLHDIVQDVLGKEPLDIVLKSLEYMNDDPAAVDVLYGKVVCLDGSDRLQNFSDEVAQAFIKEGLSQNQYDRVKLHCTLMNTIFRKKTESDKMTRSSFDASQILVKYQDFDFGPLSIREIHLSQRGAYSADGYYAPAEKIALSF